MGLFGKKEPCAICGGKVSGLLPHKIEGQCVCKECYGTVDLPPEYSTSDMTLNEFRGYMQFREENAELRKKFQTTQQVDFGFFDTKFMFDMNNRLLCMDKFLERTIFEGNQIKSFVIKEDVTPLYEGSAAGLLQYTSTVPERAMNMAPQLSQLSMLAQMRRDLERSGNNNNYRTIDITEPFKNFNVEIRFEHPYWVVFHADMSGPAFDNERPDLDEYLKSYEEQATVMDELAHALMKLAFPGAPEQRVVASGTVIQSGAGTAQAAAPDSVAEIQRFKALLDQGIITEEEFAAKKRQLLGL